MGAGCNKKGLALVAVLWVVVVLMVIVASVGRNNRLDTKVRLIRTEEIRCKWACRAGAETSVAVLNEDPRESDSLTDLWSENNSYLVNPETYPERNTNYEMPETEHEIANTRFELERCWFYVRIVDEASKLNVNTATKEQLVGLPDMSEEIADAIIDWRDEDDTPRAAGVEGGYYENLPFRYAIRNGPFRTTRELLLVKGVTEELLYGVINRQEVKNTDTETEDEMDKGWIAYLTCYSVDRNRDAGGNEKININEADENRLAESLNIRNSYARWIVENRRNNNYESIADLINKNSPKKADKSSREDSDEAVPMDLETFFDIADRITVSNDKEIAGRVNINTAPKVVLAALLGGSDADEQLAENIITYREGLIDGMESIAEVMKVGSINIDTFKKIANDITTRSDVYMVCCFATADRGGVGGTTLQTEAVVDRSSTPYKILYWYQGANN